MDEISNTPIKSTTNYSIEELEYVHNKWISISLEYMDMDESIYIWNKIKKKYTKKFRKYHNIKHLYRMIKDLEHIESSISKDFINEMYIAIFFHDYIYNIVFPSRNEQLSAKYMNKYLEYHLTDRSLNFITESILATKNHLENDNYLINIFLDLDMNILSSDRITYEKYHQAIYQELFIYSNGYIRKKRNKFLKKLLSLENIYCADIFKENDKMAKLNIKRELGE